MARITIEDCLNRVPNRFVLVHMVAQRVRQIREGSEYLVSSPKNEDIVVALREIAAGKVFLRRHRPIAAPIHEPPGLSAKPTPPSKAAPPEPASLAALDAATSPSEQVAEEEAPQAEDMSVAGEVTDPEDGAEEPLPPAAEPGTADSE
jgi:DNA-directed RNA polymerase subunit omega